MSSQVQKPIDFVKAPSRGPTPPPAGQTAESGFTLHYVSGDLFSCPEVESLAHCISEDCRMGAGIAVMFRKTFKRVDDLKKQAKKPGQCAVLKSNQRFIYYLVTKKKAYQKPTYSHLEESLEDMKAHCVSNGVTRISMPRIGCGLDRLKWDKVSGILEKVFENTNISITVYSLPEKEHTKVMKEFIRR